ncbi:hypothetical protein U1Q18_047627 [Sarracenia purpurea var. burkii]
MEFDVRADHVICFMIIANLGECFSLKLEKFVGRNLVVCRFLVQEFPSVLLYLNLMASEETIDILPTPENIVLEGGHSRRNSTGNFSKSGIKVLSRYLSVSTGSCHDLCKYGIRDIHEKNSRNSILKRRITARSGGDQHRFNKDENSEVKKKSMTDPMPLVGSKCQATKEHLVTEKKIPLSAKKMAVSTKQASDSRPKFLQTKPFSFSRSGHLSSRGYSDDSTTKEMRTSKQESRLRSQKIQKSARKSEPKKTIDEVPEKTLYVIETKPKKSIVEPTQIGDGTTHLSQYTSQSSKNYHQLGMHTSQPFPSIQCKKLRHTQKGIQITRSSSFPSLFFKRKSLGHIKNENRNALSSSPSLSLSSSSWSASESMKSDESDHIFEGSGTKPKQMSNHKVERTTIARVLSKGKVGSPGKLNFSRGKVVDVQSKNTQIRALCDDQNGKANTKTNTSHSSPSTGNKKLKHTRNGIQITRSSSSPSLFFEKKSLRLIRNENRNALSSSSSLSLLSSSSSASGFVKSDDSDPISEGGRTKTKQMSNHKIQPRRVRGIVSEGKVGSPQKLNFSRGKVVDVQSENTTPRKPLFKQIRVLGENQNGKVDSKMRTSQPLLSTERKKVRHTRNDIEITSSSASESVKSDRSDPISEVSGTKTKQTSNRKVERTSQPRRVGRVVSERKVGSPRKLNFARGKVVDAHPENTSPRRLKFKQIRVLGENQNGKADAKSRSLKKVVAVGNFNGYESEPTKVVLRHQDVEGKKKVGQSLFNNVIEETASKLVQTRKSKVKALVGAFETVISLQDTKSSATTSLP